MSFKRDFGLGLEGDGDGGESPGSLRKKKRKSRWGEDSDDKTFIPGMPTVLPQGLEKDQEELFLLQLQIEEISRRLRTGDLGIPPNPEDRSPSPEPIYNNEGKRLNTREYRTRKKLEEQRHELIQKCVDLNTEYKPPSDYKPPVIKVTDKVMIPQEEHPDINFVGLLIGPRGNTLKNLEKETGAKIIIRGKGSVKEGKIGRKDGQPLPGEDEPLHAYITANNPEHVRKASTKIHDIIKQGIEVPEQQNDLRRQQLRELALLNGTLRENDGLAKLKQLQQAQTIITNTIVCAKCGGTGHLSKDCMQARPGDTLRTLTNQPAPFDRVDKAKMDSEYSALMAELGEGPPSGNDGMMRRPPPQQQQQNNQNNRTGGGGGGGPFNRPQQFNSPPPGVPPPHQMQRPPPFNQPPPMSRPPVPQGLQQQPPPAGFPPTSQPGHPPPSLAAPPHSLSGMPPPRLTSMSLPPPINSSQAPPPLMSQQPMPPHSTSAAPSVNPSSSAPLPWQQQASAASTISTPPAMPTPTLSTTINTSGPPPPSMMAPPPPPPPSSQSLPWHQGPPPQHSNFGLPPPPAPPGGTGNPAPWQQHQQQHQQQSCPPPPLAPPPPSGNIPPWHQQPPPPGPPAHPHMLPPPPPPGGQSFSGPAPPPPPPGSDAGLPAGIPLGVPPPPPPS